MERPRRYWLLPACPEVLSILCVDTRPPDRTGSRRPAPTRQDTFCGIDGTRHRASAAIVSLHCQPSPGIATVTSLSGGAPMALPPKLVGFCRPVRK